MTRSKEITHSCEVCGTVIPDGKQYCDNCNNILATSVEVAPSIIGEHSWEPVRISSKKRTAEELQTFHTSDRTQSEKRRRKDGDFLIKCPNCIYKGCSNCDEVRKAAVSRKQSVLPAGAKTVDKSSPLVTSRSPLSDFSSVSCPSAPLGTFSTTPLNPISYFQSVSRTTVEPESASSMSFSSSCIDTTLKSALCSQCTKATTHPLNLFFPGCEDALISTKCSTLSSASSLCSSFIVATKYSCPKCGVADATDLFHLYCSACSNSSSTSLSSSSTASSSLSTS